MADAATLGGDTVLIGLMHPIRGTGFWSERPEKDLFANNAHFFEVFEVFDYTESQQITQCAIEAQFLPND